MIRLCREQLPHIICATLAGLLLPVFPALAQTPPEAPVAPVVVADSSRALTVAWEAPLSTGSSITDYDVQYRVGASGLFTEHEFTGTATSTLILGLSMATAYEVQVRAANADREGEWSPSGMGSTSASNTPPRLMGTMQLTVSRGGTFVFTSNELGLTDTDNTPAELTYVLYNVPLHGTLQLQLDGAMNVLEALDVLAPGPERGVNSFTQADVDAGLVSYVHDDGAEVLDLFNFNVGDPEHAEVLAERPTFTITIQQPPTAVATGPSTVAESEAPMAPATVMLDGTGSTDPEGGDLAYAWRQESGPSVVLTGVDMVTPTFEVPNLPASADVEFSLRVTDPQGLTGEAGVTISIVADNDFPIAQVGENRDVPEGVPVQGADVRVMLDGSGSVDPEGVAALVYKWRQLSGQSVNLMASDTATPAFLTPFFHVVGDEALVFELEVREIIQGTGDPSGLREDGQGMARVAITITELPEVRIESPAGVDKIDEGNTFTFTVKSAVAAPAGGIVVEYRVSPDVNTGAGSADFDSLSGRVTIPMDETETTLGVDVLDDDLSEGIETFNVSIFRVSPATFVKPSRASGNSRTITIVASDPLTAALEGPVTVGEVDTANYTVTMSGGRPSKAVTVDYAVAGGPGIPATAANFGGSAFPTGTVTIPEGRASMSFAVDIAADDTGSEETFTVTLSNLAGGGGTVTLDVDRSVVTTTIVEVVTVAIVPTVRLNEGDSATIAVTSGAAAPAGGIEVTYMVAAGTAEATDFTVASSPVIIEEGMTSAGIGVVVTDDNLSERDETFTITLTSVMAASSDSFRLGSVSSSRVTIAPSDEITVSLTGPALMGEGARDVIYTVSLSGGVPTAEMRLFYDVEGGGGGPGVAAATVADFGGGFPVGIVIISAGETSKMLVGPVLAVADKEDEPDEAFTLILSRPTGGGGPTPRLGVSRVVTRITEVSVLGIHTSFVSDVVEGAMVDSITIVFFPSLPAGVPVTVGYTVTAGTADSADFTFPSSAVSFPAGFSVVQPGMGEQPTGMFMLNSVIDSGRVPVPVPVTVIDDDLSEGDETFVFTVVSVTTQPSGLARIDPGGLSAATITIPENDFLEVALAGPVDVKEGQTATYTVTLSGGISTADVVVNYAIAGTAVLVTHYAAPASGTAMVEANGLDARLGTVTIPSGVASADFTIDTVPRGVMDDESVMVTLSNPTGGGGRTPDLGTVVVTTTIQDATDISVPATLSVDEGGSTTLTVTAESAVEADTTVEYTVTAETAGAEDYSVTGSSVVISAGGTAADLPISGMQDKLFENAETFTVTLDSVSSTANDVELSASATATTVTILKDADDAITVSLAGDGAVYEGETATYTVTLSGGISTADVVVSYAIAGTAVLVTHYAAPASRTAMVEANGLDARLGTVTIPSGVASVDFTIDTVARGVMDDESVMVTLSSPTGGGGGTPDLGTVVVTTTIQDATDISVPATLSVAEGGSTTLTVTAESAVEADTTVEYTVTAETAGAEDYSVTGSSVVISAGGTAADLPISGMQDNLFENAETFTVTLDSVSSTANDVELSASATATTVTILKDADDAITVSLAGDGAVYEGETATYTVTLSGGISTADVVVNYVIAGTAVLVTHYAAPASGTAMVEANGLDARMGTVTIPSGVASADFTIDTVPRGVMDDESVMVTLSNPVGGGGGTPDLGTVVVTTTIQDATDISVPATLSVAEGGSTTLTVTAESAVEADTTVEYTVTAETAGAEDYSVTGSSVVISAGGTAADLPISGMQDKLFENAETFTVTLDSVSSTANDVELSASATATTVTIPEDADDAITVSLTTDSGSVVREGDTATYRVTLRGGTSTADVMVPYALSGTAGRDTDYTVPDPLMLTIAVGEPEGTILIVTTDDGTGDADETLIVTLEMPTGGGGPAGSLTVEGTANAVTTTLSEAISISMEAAATVIEGGTVVLPVTLTKAAPAGGITVSYTISDGSNPGEAAAVDYMDETVTAGSISFSAGANTANMEITAVDDANSEGEEDFTVTLGAVTVGDAVVSSTAGVTVVTIGASDPVTVSLTMDSGSVVREGETATYTVTLSGGTSTAAVTVNYAVTGGSPAPTGPAIGDPVTPAVAADFGGSFPTGMVTIPAGMRSVTFDVDTVADDTDDEAEFTVTLSSPAGGGGAVSLAVDGSVFATVITEEEVPGTIAGVREVTIAAAVEVTEGGSATVTVTSSVDAPVGGIVVTYTLTVEVGDTALATDFSGTGGTVTILEGERDIDIRVDAIQDANAEEDETFTVTLTGVTPASVALGSLSSSTATIGANTGIDLDEDDVVGIKDAKLFYYALLSELDSAGRMAAMHSVDSAVDVAAIVATTDILIGAGGRPAALDLDFNADNNVDFQDAVLFYYTLALPGSLGVGSIRDEPDVVREATASAIFGPLVKDGPLAGSPEEVLNRVNSLFNP